jgi:CheY-like chemotaxis protein
MNGVGGAIQWAGGGNPLGGMGEWGTSADPLSGPSESLLRKLKALAWRPGEGRMDSHSHFSGSISGGGAAGKPGKARKVVLVVDDNKSIRELVVCVLESQGYRVVEARNGLEALAVCEREKWGIDLVVTDLVMPEMDGVELCRRVRSLWPGVGTLLMTGSEQAVEDKALRGLGARMMLKPFSAPTLLEKVREAMGRVGAQ